MKSVTLIVSMLFSGIMAGTIQLERRKSFVETHQEHGHLPGGNNNPGFGVSLIPQVLSILGGQNPLSILNGYNKKADESEGKESPAEGASEGGLLSGLGLSGILGG